MFNHYNILEKLLFSFFMYVEWTQFNNMFLTLNYYTQKADLFCATVPTVFGRHAYI